MTYALVTMGWLLLVGSSKLQVSFAEYAFFYRALLQKSRIILTSLRIVATPYAKCNCVTRLYVYWSHELYIYERVTN